MELQKEKTNRFFLLSSRRKYKLMRQVTELLFKIAHILHQIIGFWVRNCSTK